MAMSAKSATRHSTGTSITDDFVWVSKCAIAWHQVPLFIWPLHNLNFCYIKRSCNTFLRKTILWTRLWKSKLLGGIKNVQWIVQRWPRPRLRSPNTLWRLQLHMDFAHFVVLVLLWWQIEKLQPVHQPNMPNLDGRIALLLRWPQNWRRLQITRLHKQAKGGTEVLPFLQQTNSNFAPCF